MWPGNAAVAGKIRRDRLQLQASDEICGDPARGGRNELRIEYEFQGHRYTASVLEGEWLSPP